MDAKGRQSSVCNVFDDDVTHLLGKVHWIASVFKFY